MKELDVYELASQEVRDAAEKLTGGDPTQDDMEIARIISNMAVDVTRGDHKEAQLYLDGIAAAHPALLRLMGRVGLAMAKSVKATKQ
jgi:predicted ATPase